MIQTESDRQPYALLPAQIAFLHLESPEPDLDVCLYQGGYGSGKTFIGAFLGIELSEKYPHNRGLVAASTYPMVRDTTLETYFAHFDAYGYEEGRDYRWRASESKLLFPNGSTILFRHLETPYKLKSLNLGWAHLEEMSEVSEAVFLMILSRLRLAHIPRYRLFGTSNPQPGQGWFSRYFDPLPKDPTASITVPSTLESQQRIVYRRIIAPSTENRFLSPTYLDNMAQQFDPEYYRMNVLGQDGDYTAGLVCKTWSDANIEMEEVTLQADRPIYLSCDFNVDPMCWILCQRMNGDYHFFAELCLENTTTVEAAETFARLYGEHQAGVVITGDASGGNRGTKAKSPLDTDYTILRNALTHAGMRNVQLDLPSKNPFVEDRVSIWNGLVCNSQGVRRIKVNPACEWLIHNCRTLRYIPGTRVIEEPTPRQIQHDRKLKFTKHIFDAASYLTARYSPIQLQKPSQNALGGSSKTSRISMVRFQP